jgi:hypothetical protein
MSKTATLVNFEGAITFGTIEMLLTRLRNCEEFQEMQKPVKKRLYSVFVESIDNIYKYGAKLPGEERRAGRFPKISVTREEGNYLVKAGNLVMNDDVLELKFKLDKVNQLDNEALKTLFEEVITQESSPSDTGAGLGLITMAMKTQKDIGYNFVPVDRDHSIFEIQLTVNV